MASFVFSPEGQPITSNFRSLGFVKVVINAPPPEINSCKCLVCFNIEGGVVSGSCWIYGVNPAVGFSFL